MVQKNNRVFWKQTYFKKLEDKHLKTAQLYKLVDCYKQSMKWTKNMEQIRWVWIYRYAPTILIVDMIAGPLHVQSCLHFLLALIDPCTPTIAYRKWAMGPFQTIVAFLTSIFLPPESLRRECLEQEINIFPCVLRDLLMLWELWLSEGTIQKSKSGLNPGPADWGATAMLLVSESE